MKRSLFQAGVFLLGQMLSTWDLILAATLY